MEKANAIWTETALNSMREIIDYLYDDWSVKEVDGFLNEVDSCIVHLENFTKIGVQHGKTEFRKLLVNKHIYLFYSVSRDKKSIFLRCFWNNHKNPDKLGNILFS